MAKGQMKSQREIRKPKKDASTKAKSSSATVQATFAQPASKGGKKK